MEKSKSKLLKCIFGGSISVNDIPSFSVWDTVGYITCSSVSFDRVPITYNWA